MSIKIIRFTDWDIEVRFEDRDGTKVIRNFYCPREGGQVSEGVGEFVSSDLTKRGGALYCEADQDLGEVVTRAIRRYLRT